MRQITKIYIHCSYSEWGNVDVIRRWHTEPPLNWSDIGYHYIINNQFPTKKVLDDFKLTGKFTSTTDGEIVKGRPLSIMGAHVKNDNKYSIGICYIGITPTPAQWSSLLTLCAYLIKKYPLLNLENVLGHYEYYKQKGEPIKKTCPNFNLVGFRKQLSLII